MRSKANLPARFELHWTFYYEIIEDIGTVLSIIRGLYMSGVNVGEKSPSLTEQ